MGSKEAIGGPGKRASLTSECSYELSSEGWGRRDGSRKLVTTDDLSEQMLS